MVSGKNKTFLPRMSDGQVGGRPRFFIGAVHRRADTRRRRELVGGAFSYPGKEQGLGQGSSTSRNRPRVYQEMIEAELRLPRASASTLSRGHANHMHTRCPCLCRRRLSVAVTSAGGQL